MQEEFNDDQEKDQVGDGEPDVDMAQSNESRVPRRRS